MSVQEQQQTKEKYYREALRYMANAKECLKNARKEGNYYRDPKYVRMACGTAYNGTLIALDGYLSLKGVERAKGRGKKSIEYYQENVSKIDRKMLDHLNGAYHILHLSGYYDGIGNANVIKEGFEEAYKIINKIKPFEVNGTAHTAE